MLGTVLLVILVLLLLGAIPRTGAYNEGWPIWPSGLVGILIVVLVVLLILGRI
jgi:membrane protein YdbS with pleckstrin-like domain